MPQPTARNVATLTLYPFAKTSAEWNDVDAALRNSAFFSACIEDERMLGALQKLVAQSVENKQSVGGFVDDALHLLERIAADPATIKDETFDDNFSRLYDIERLRLIYTTQMALCSGYRQFQAHFSPFQLRAFPAWRFVRQPGAKEQNKRADHVRHENDVRLKTDVQYWLARNSPDIGGFGNPYGPWGFNSWMREVPVKRDEAERLGLIKPGEEAEVPAELAEWTLPRALQQVGQASVDDLTPAQQQRVIDRCANVGVKVARADKSLQVVPDTTNPNDPLARLDDAAFEAWVRDEARRLDGMSESDWLSVWLGQKLGQKLFKGVEKIFSGKRRAQPLTLPDGSRCFTEDCRRHKWSLETVQAAKKAVQEYKATRMRAAQAHAKSVLPREVATPLEDVPLAALNGSDIKEMLCSKALFSSACNGVKLEVHEEAVLRTPELIAKAKEKRRRDGGKKDNVVTRNGSEVHREDPVSEIIELDADFIAAHGGSYTACYRVQKYKQQNMKPKVYFMCCKKTE